MRHTEEVTHRQLRDHLDLLHSELRVAMTTDLRDDCAYMQDLYAELNETKGAIVIAAVTEIALRRGPLYG
jgi:hypothetical protein